MREITLGRTGITVPQNAFGCLPIQRVTKVEAVHLLRRAYAGGMRFFDTARAYSDSVEKVGAAFGKGSLPGGGAIRDQVFLATKTAAKTPEAFWKDLSTSLEKLQTDHIDVYQFHQAGQCYRPGDGTGMYECMLEAKRQGKIRHIGVTAHRIGVAMECAASGLYETLQFPFSYLSGEQELELVRTCRENGVGFIAMKGLAGGLITRADAAYGFMEEQGGVLPIWGIQREKELDDWLSFFEKDAPVMTDKIRAFIKEEKKELSGDFCRGCGYCMPCPAGIEINNCARMSLMLRRAPSENWLTPEWQEKMNRIDQCLGCRQCTKKCPYELNTPELLKKNLADYRRVLAGEVSVGQ